MKKLFRNLLMLTTIASLGLMYSCNQDEETFDAPVVSFTSTVLEDDGTATLQPGDVLSFVLSVDAPGGFNTLNGSIYADGTKVNDGDTTISKTPGTSPLEYTSEQFNYEVSSDDVGVTYTLEYQAIDELGQMSNVLTFTVEITSPDARSYSAKLLAAPLGDKSAKSFFSVATGTTYSPTEVTGTSEAISPTIDFGYYYGANDMASIASPNGFLSTTFSAQVTGWTTKNATVVKATTLGASDFTEVTTWADIDEAFEAGTDEEEIITQLAAGNVVAFETVGGVRGLILVKEIIDGNQDGKFDGSTDKLSIDVLAQLSSE